MFLKGFPKIFATAILWNTCELPCLLKKLFKRSYKYIPRLFQIKGVPRIPKVILKLNSNSRMWFYQKTSQQISPFGVVLKHPQKTREAWLLKGYLRPK